VGKLFLVRGFVARAARGMCYSAVCLLGPGGVWGCECCVGWGGGLAGVCQDCLVWLEWAGRMGFTLTIAVLLCVSQSEE